MKNITQLQHQVHMSMLQYQRLYRYLCSQRFSMAYELATDEQITELEKFLQENNKQAIVKWTKKLLQSEYESYNMTDLRSLARKLGIQYYQTETRDGLLSQISLVLDKE